MSMIYSKGSNPSLSKVSECSAPIRVSKYSISMSDHSIICRNIENVSIRRTIIKHRYHYRSIHYGSYIAEPMANQGYNY